MNVPGDRSVAVVLAAHGDRGGTGGNSHLAKHAAALTENGNFAGVFFGVLNGEPGIDAALKEADACGADQIVVYPLFMSAGYFVKKVLADRISSAGLKTPTGLMQPLGLDKRLALLMLEHGLRVSKAANVDPKSARFLVVGHGSKNGSESANSTRRAAKLLEDHSPYAVVETAFIEEEPFLEDALANHDGTTVVAGFLSGDGLHSGEDLPNAIKDSGARALYTGPIGIHPRVPDLILSTVQRALEEQSADVVRDVPPEPVTVKREEQPAEPERTVAPPPEPAPEPEPPAPEPLEEAIPSEDAEIQAAAAKKAARKAKRTRRRFSPMRLAFKAVATLFIMAVLAIIAIPFFVSEDVIRDRAVSLVKEKTGRTLTIGGKTSFGVFPNIGVEMEKVALSNPPGMAQGEMLRMDALNLNLKLVPLFSKRVEIDSFVLERPVFNLVVDGQGRKNWDFAKTAALSNPQPKFAFAQAAGGVAGGAVQDIRLGEVRIYDGTVNFSDETSGTRQSVKALNVTLQQSQLTEPLNADGDLTWRGEKVTFDGQVRDVPALMNQKSSAAEFNVASRFGKSDFKGTLSTTKGFVAKGDLTGESPSIRGLAGWLGDPLPPGGGLGAFTVKGKLNVAGDTITFSNARMSLDGMTGNGQVTVRTKGAKPFVSAALALDKLDLNPYILGQSTSRSIGPAPAAKQPAQPAAAPPQKRVIAPGQGGTVVQPQQGQSLTDFIKKLDQQPNPQVRAWSQEAINLAGLKAVDADFKLSTKAIYARDIKTGAGTVNANIRSGILTANMPRLSLYSGSGTGVVILNGASAVSNMTADFKLNGISALPLLKDAAKFKWISGRANLAINVSGTGRSQSDMMRSLRGRGQFAFTDGAIEGVNIPAMLRGLRQGRFDGWKQNDRQKTDFSQLTASFTVQRGVAFNQDLNLVGPLLRATGKGNIDIGNERLDYSALPRLVGTLEGQGAQADQRKGIAVPVRVRGAWANPKVSLDLKRLLEDPELAQDAVNEVGDLLKNLKKEDGGGDLGNVLQGILGGGQQQQPATPGTPQQGSPQVDPNNVLRNLLQR